jgi:glycosyltransferase involved in cell wall biosynthesis
MSSSKQPLVTIGMTAYNARATIADALKSVLAQSWDNIELVIVDDCSTDKTYEFLEEFAAHHKNVRLFRQPENKGVAFARHRIVEEAKGEFIAFFDDDDVSVPERVARQYERIVEYEKNFADGAPVICHTARTQRYPDGVVRLEPTMGTVVGVIAPHGAAVARRILTGKPIANVFGSAATCSQMGRTENYRRLGNFDPDFRRGQDTEFNIRFALAGGHFVGIADPLVVQSMTYGSEKRLEQEKEFFIKAIEKHSEFVEEYVSKDFAVSWIETKYIYMENRKGEFVWALIRLFFKYPMNVLARLYWALPNIRFNKQFSRFHTKEVR